MPTNKALDRGCYYHIFHRGNNREPIFFEKKNYHFFLERYVKYIEPIAFTYAYCLMIGLVIVKRFNWRMNMTLMRN